MSPKEKKQDPRVIRTRRDLIYGMCDLLKEKKFSKITIQDITDRALINRATFYSHFEDKYDLLDAMLNFTLKQKLDEREVTDGSVTPENIRRLTLVICEFLIEFHEEQSPVQYGETPPIERQILQYLFAFLSSGVQSIHPDKSTADVENMAMMTSSVILGATFHWSRGDQAIEKETLADQIVSFIFNGLKMTS